MAKWLVNLELGQNQITQPVIHNLASAPSDGVEGQMYYNTASDKMFYNDGGGGSSWVEFGTGSGSVSTVSGGVGISDSGSGSDPVLDLDYSGSEMTAGSTFDVNDRIAIFDNTASAMRYLTRTQVISELEGDLNFEVPITASTGLLRSTNDIQLDYAGTNNFIDTATNLEGTAIATGDTIVYHDASDDNVKKGFVSDLPFSSTTGTVTNVNDGDGMTFTAITSTGDVTMGTPGGITNSSTDAVSTNSHTHSITLASTDLSDTSAIAYLGNIQSFTNNNTFDNVVIASTAPTLDSHLTNKAYVDSVAQGLDIKASVRIASAADIPGTYTNTGGTSGRGQFTVMADTDIDGVALVDGDRILLKDQTGSGAENGIWVITDVGTGSNGIWDRATDFDEDDEVTAGSFCFVEEGTLNADTGWVLTTDDPIIIGGASGDVLVWAQFSGAGSYTAGDGLDLGGSEFTLTTPTTNLSGASTNAVAAGGHTHAIDTGIANTNIVQAETGATNNYVTIWTTTGITGEQYLGASRGGLGIDLSGAANGTLLMGNGTGFDINTLDSTDGTITRSVGSGTIDIEVRAASTSQTGVAESAIQSEVNTGTDTVLYVSPDTLRGTPDISRPGSNISTRKYAMASAASTSTTVTHNFGTRQVQVEIYETATPWETVYADVARTSTNVVTVTFAVAASADEFTIVVVG
jgi:hypothetical protein